MKHSVTTSHLTHTIEMTPDEALTLIAEMAKMVRLATSQAKVASHFGHEMEVTIPDGTKLLGGLLLVVRTE